MEVGWIFQLAEGDTPQMGDAPVLDQFKIRLWRIIVIEAFELLVIAAAVYFIVSEGIRRWRAGFP